MMLIRRLLLVACSLAVTLPARSAERSPEASGARSLEELYQFLHANPELSFQEQKTASLLAEEARTSGFEVTENIGKTGLVAVMRNGPGPVLMIRTDMDALPVTEDTGLTFASRVTAKNTAGEKVGVMHACGHDTHMTAWVGTLRRMAKRKTEWSGTLIMIAQPAEELGQGARLMIGDGLFDRFPKPDVALAFHNSATLPAGTIGITEGYALANVDSVDITVKGKGGHGAAPHETLDPIVLGSKIVLALQTLVSREINPLDPAVVTVGKFEAGTKRNIIPDEALLQLTVRSYKPEVRKKLLDGISRISRGEAAASGAYGKMMPEVRITKETTPSTYNDPELARRFKELIQEKQSEIKVVEADPVMLGEDFGRYRLSSPNTKSLIFWVGGVPKETWEKHVVDGESIPSLHSPKWAPDYRSVIQNAADAFVAYAIDFLRHPGREISKP